MSSRASALTRATTVIVCALLLGSLAGGEAKVYGAPSNQPNDPHLTVVVPDAPVDSSPAAPANARTGFDGLPARAQQAVAAAAKQGADLGILVRDRNTGQEITSGQTAGLVTASVAKLFIADDLLSRQPNLAPADRTELETMLRSSDDSAAEDFWNRGGGNVIITRVAARYGLTGTTVPYDGRWWNTITSARDLARYYDMLLNGSGGLAPGLANIIINNLSQSTASGIDGYPQRFGIPDGLYDEPVAVKQGWMCCWNGPNWMHLSTGIIGPERRYLMVVYSLQPSDDATARATITQAVKTTFPGGKI